MASRTRHQTDKVGVFYILSEQRPKSKPVSWEGSANGKPDKIYYIMYRLDGKKIEEKIGPLVGTYDRRQSSKNTGTAYSWPYFAQY